MTFDQTIKCPKGVTLIPLETHTDERGELNEIHRDSWGLAHVSQTNLVRSIPNVMRGIHVHATHSDNLMVLSGTLILGLHDIRRQSPTYNQSFIIELKGDNPQRCLIPIGVAHGFYFPEDTTYLYGLSREWSPDDHLGCRWDDENASIPWPFDHQPIVSPRDANPMPYQEMVAGFEEAMSMGSSS